MFWESGQPEELLEKYGMSVEAIKMAVKNVIKGKYPPDRLVLGGQEGGEINGGSKSD